MIERLCVRLLVAAVLCAAVAVSLLSPLPIDANGDPALPASAFEQVGLYRLEVVLLVFYGGLLLITPVFSGLIRGRLPIEISTRGARFAEKADEAATRDEAAIEKLEGAVDSLDQRLTETTIAFEKATKARQPDSTQQEVGSER